MPSQPTEYLRPITPELEPHETAHLLDVIEHGFQLALLVSSDPYATADELAARLAVARELEFLSVDEMSASYYSDQRRIFESIPQMLDRTAADCQSCRLLETEIGMQLRETAFGWASADYQTAQEAADRMALAEASPYVVARNFGSRLFEILPGRLADEFTSRFDAKVRYWTDGDWNTEAALRALPPEAGQ